MNRDEQLADKELSPLIKFAEKNPGTIAKVTARLAKLLDCKVHRQMVEGWLHPDPAKRTQPRLGMGLLLMKVRDEIKKQTKADRVRMGVAKESYETKPVN